MELLVWLLVAPNQPGSPGWEAGTHHIGQARRQSVTDDGKKACELQLREGHAASTDLNYLVTGNSKIFLKII